MGIEGQNLANGPHGVNIQRPPRFYRSQAHQGAREGCRGGELNPGETKRGTLALTERDLSYYNVSLHRWVAEDGKYHVLVGSSSRDIRLQGSFYHSNTKDYTIRRVGEDMIG